MYWIRLVEVTNMKTFIHKIKQLLPTKRKLMQLYFALLFNANMKGYASGQIYKGNVKKMCVPGINCYSCPGAVGACPLGSLQGSFSADKSTIFYVGGILLLYSFLFGRMICGWLCPFGLIQELLYKIKTPKVRKNAFTRILSYFKYVVLVFFVFIVPITYAFRDTPLPAFCKFICPAGTLEGGILLLANKANNDFFDMLGPLFTWKFVLMISMLVGCIFIFRLFCRFICPLGALYGLFNKLSLFGVKIEQPKCTNCNLCVNHCKLDIKHVGDQECIACGECINVCPTQAIVWKGPKLLPDSIKEHKTARLITRCISLLLLIGLLACSIVYFWNESSKEQANQVEQPQITDDENARGNEVGDLCFEMDLPIIDSTSITENTISPTSLNKITIINFWGTWCTPCVNELPYFEQIANEYKDTVSVIAIHSFLSVETAPNYIGKYYPDSQMIFAGDLDNAAYYTKLGGTGAYPYTLVLDADGVIVKTFVGSLKYEDLKEVVEDILK